MYLYVGTYRFTNTLFFIHSISILITVFLLFDCHGDGNYKLSVKCKAGFT